MKHIALLAAIGAGLLAVPGSASAACTGPVQVTDTGSAIHVCGNVAGLGGDAELAKNGSYGWVDGFDTNPANSAGYAGFNNGGISDTSKDSNCDGNDTASPSNNSGGCFWIRSAPAGVNSALQNAVTAMFICGDTSGPSHTASTRDGCSVPAAPNVGPIDLFAGSAEHSATCTSPTHTILNGNFGGVQLRLIEQENPGSVWICVRVASAGTALGGKLTIAAPSVSPGVPTVDETADACRTTAGNQVPPPHPLIGGTVADTDVLFDTWASGTEVWACLSVEGAGAKRIRVSVPPVPAGAVAFYPDEA